MVAESHNHGVPINLVRALGVRVISGWRPDDDLVYGSFLDQALRILAYKPKAFTPGQSAPILLYIHGGGWSLGDRFESGSNLRWFADRGSLALSIDYTLSSVDRHLWDTTTSQVHARWPGLRPMQPGSAAIPPAARTPERSRLRGEHAVQFKPAEKLIRPQFGGRAGPSQAKAMAAALIEMQFRGPSGLVPAIQ